MTTTPSDDTNQTPQAAQKCGFVALMGLPNAGKSTLLNTLLDQHLAITSRTSGTTRFPLRGIGLFKNTQLILIDTPGLFQKAHSTLERAMLQSAESAPLEADLWVLVVDVTKGKSQLDHILSHFEQTGRPPLWVVLNKIDCVKKGSLLNWAAAYQNKVERLFMISARDKDGTDDLREALIEAMPQGPWLFDQDVVTTLDKRLMAAEITREVLLDFLKEEIPHYLYVETEKTERAPRKALKIHQVIHVGEKTHKRIILGKAGHKIKEIGQEARQRMQARLGHPVHLFLYVRHTPLWMERTSFYHMVGLDMAPPLKPKTPKTSTQKNKS